MPDIGILELLLLGLVILLVMGPEQLPAFARTLGLWAGRLRRSFHDFRAELEREIGMDEIRRELHNETILKDFPNQQENPSSGVAAEIKAPVQSGAPPSNQPPDGTSRPPSSG